MQPLWVLLKGSGVFTADQGLYGGFELQIQILKLATIDDPGLYVIRARNLFLHWW